MDYNDDLEIVNPLGSYTGIHKVGVKYTIIKGVPPILNSRLENIMLNTIIVASDRRKFSDEDCFDKYIDEMTDLKLNSFTCFVDRPEYKIYVPVVQVIGDNLAVNSLLSFTESFAATYPCRVCKMTREDISTNFYENT